MAVILLYMYFIQINIASEGYLRKILVSRTVKFPEPLGYLTVLETGIFHK